MFQKKIFSPKFWAKKEKCQRTFKLFRFSISTLPLPRSIKKNTSTILYRSENSLYIEIIDSLTNTNTNNILFIYLLEKEEEE